MALGTAEGLAEERRLFYVAVTRARDQLYLYAPLRMHHRRTARDDRHSYAPLTRFLDDAALAACEVTDAPPVPLLPRSDPWPPRSTRPSVPSGTAETLKASKLA